MIRRSLNQIRSLLGGEGLRARALRGSFLTLASIGGSNVLRLVSNLILTRLLFPEAFGLMALVSVFIGGLAMFSDLGVSASIIQNKRGDEPDFLNTAWTMQIGRGVLLWLGACALSLPVARIYDEPMLAQLLPVVSLGLILSGLSSTKLATANRHLLLGRVTMLELAAQAAGIASMVLFAFVYPSVWSLVVGGFVSNIVKTIGSHLVLPGMRNRLHLDRRIVSELFHFGKYIFLSTVAGYFLNQSDRAILGAYIPIDQLGIYSIGVMLGLLPLTLGRAAGRRVVFPLYRMRPPAESAQNRAQMLRARRLLISALLLVNTVLAFASVPLIDLLYDPRYAQAGAVMTLSCLAAVPQLMSLGYTSVLLANGNSQRFAFEVFLTAALQVPFMFWGVIHVGIPGAALASGLAILLVHPMRIIFVRRYKAWDAKGDAAFLLIGLVVNAAACWLYSTEIRALLP